ncbi:hypothetical protein ERJ75_000290700 [Trypanosoma vivax]|nr:hypothetical protein ERJ75_000290700 [Trypanosoma vivax]
MKAGETEAEVRRSTGNAYTRTASGEEHGRKAALQQRKRTAGRRTGREEQLGALVGVTSKRGVQKDRNRAQGADAQTNVPPHKERSFGEEVNKVTEHDWSPWRCGVNDEVAKEEGTQDDMRGRNWVEDVGVHKGGEELPNESRTSGEQSGEAFGSGDCDCGVAGE